MGKQQGNWWPLGKRTTVIGRGENLLVQILDDLVSRKHLQIRYDADANQYVAMDMNSSNGVYVNNRRITADTVLCDGDSLSIGRSVLLFTDKDFDDRESALSHFKKVGERMRATTYQPRDGENDRRS
jgi:pSer/pThr/pTyr-binding forkhead associated (FHA) protein